MGSCLQSTRALLISGRELRDSSSDAGANLRSQEGPGPMATLNRHRLISCLVEKGSSPSEAQKLVDRMWPVFSAILDCLRDVEAI